MVFTLGCVPVLLGQPLQKLYFDIIAYHNNTERSHYTGMYTYYDLLELIVVLNFNIAIHLWTTTHH